MLVFQNHGLSSMSNIEKYQFCIYDDYVFMYSWNIMFILCTRFALFTITEQLSYPSHTFLLLDFLHSSLVLRTLDRVSERV